MRRYRFRLEPVLRVRQIEQDAAQAELVAARRELDAAETERHLAVERYAGRRGPAGPATAASWLAQRDLADRAAAAVRSAETACGTANDTVDERRHALQDARTRTHTLERLDERRREEHRVEALRQADAETDELVTARHGRTS